MRTPRAALLPLVVLSAAGAFFVAGCELFPASATLETPSERIAFFEMISTDYRMYQNGELEYEFEAESVVSDPGFRSAEIDRILISGKRKSDGEVYTLGAGKARKSGESKWLELKDGFEMIAGNQIRLEAEAVRFHLEHEILESKAPVSGTVRGGTVSASSMLYDLGQSHLKLTDVSWRFDELP